MPRSSEIIHFATLITDLEISAVRAIVSGNAAALADIRLQLIEARIDIWALLSHDALKAAGHLDRDLVDAAIGRGRRDEVRS